jgi:hypothetical protein
MDKIALGDPIAGFAGTTGQGSRRERFRVFILYDLISVEQTDSIAHQNAGVDLDLLETVHRYPRGQDLGNPATGRGNVALKRLTRWPQNHRRPLLIADCGFGLQLKRVAAVNPQSAIRNPQSLSIQILFHICITIPFLS